MARLRPSKCSEFQLTATIGLAELPLVNACIFLRNRSWMASEVLPPFPAPFNPTALGIDRPHENSSGSMTIGFRSRSNCSSSEVWVVVAPVRSSS